MDLEKLFVGVAKRESLRSVDAKAAVSCDLRNGGWSGD
jgi:hypothetical protein